MAYALESSKRKFHHLLDSISSTPSASMASAHALNVPSSPSQPSPQPPAAKRVRLDLARMPSSFEPKSQVERLKSSSGTDLSVSSLRSVRAVSQNVKTEIRRAPYTTLGGDRVAPYAPSSRADFLLRLKTFSFQGIVNWHLKPDAINEVQWAKHGWVLQGRETVRCTNCHRQIVVECAEGDEDDCTDGDAAGDASGDADADGAGDETPAERQALRRETAQALAAKYAALMADGHDERCLWRSRPCDGACHIPLPRPAC